MFMTSRKKVVTTDNSLDPGDTDGMPMARLKRSCELRFMLVLITACLVGNFVFIYYHVHRHDKVEGSAKSIDTINQERINKDDLVYADDPADNQREPVPLRHQIALQDDRTTNKKDALNVDNPPEADVKKLGFDGKGVKLDLSPDGKKIETERFERHAFNEFVSSKISIHRTLADGRYPECRNLTYPDDLPMTSIVICFHNEAWSTLLRTINSILDRSPLRLVKEIVLVDDGSTMEHLLDPLEDYLATIHSVRIRIIRLYARVGLIKARVRGVNELDAETFTFLDSHVEVMTGWLEPLLARIKEDPSLIVIPVIDEIDLNTFHYRVVPEPLQRGGFNWQFMFRWKPVPNYKSRKSRVEPIKTPAMPGGLLTMNRELFLKLGSFDPGFEVWGGENIEESLKVWMCGGSIEIIPCSRVGHVYRTKSPYTFLGKDPVSVVHHNSARVVEVWADEFKEEFYKRLPAVKKKGFGDVTSRRELRESLQCKDFKWYLDNAYPELYVPTKEFVLQSTVQFRNKGVNLCLDSNDQNGQTGTNLLIWGCHGLGGNQYFEVTKVGEIRNEELCLDAYNRGTHVLMTDCSKIGSPSPTQVWQIKPDGRVFNAKRNRCLYAAMPQRGTLVETRPCIPTDPKQQWTL